MATQPKEIIAEISKEIKEIIETFNHLEYEIDKLFNNVERVKGDYTATEAEMVVAAATDPGTESAYMTASEVKRNRQLGWDRFKDGIDTRTASEIRESDKVINAMPEV